MFGKLKAPVYDAPLSDDQIIQSLSGWQEHIDICAHLRCLPSLDNPIIWTLNNDGIAHVAVIGTNFQNIAEIRGTSELIRQDVGSIFGFVVLAHARERDVNTQVATDVMYLQIITRKSHSSTKRIIVDSSGRPSGKWKKTTLPVFPVNVIKPLIDTM
ncbi:MAG: hypothetical protein EOP45_08220 [Sphingobacteriaceae bacterium]|nr:MAG: hypothetical protein EOP45_08220 [Sphingobacteriaceae bacterium]